MADKKKMSIAEILAAARAADGKGAPAAASHESAPTEQPAAAAEESVSSPKSPAIPGARPNVADIMALARAKKAEAPAEAAKPPPAPKAAAGPAKAAAKPAESGGRSGVQRDTASILAAARAGEKPGPVSKAEAPERPVAAKPKEPGAAKPAPRIVPPRPAKPVKPVAKDAGEDRRSFLQMATGSALALGFSTLSVTGGLFTLGLARFMFPNVLAEPPSTFKVGSKEGFPLGKVETKFVAQFGVWVVNSEYEGQQQIYALQTVCTHLGCTPSWLEAEQKFKCPCHGSGFYKDGINFEGPAPRPLERYAIQVADDGQLQIDKSRRFQEELGQWADPASYVSV